MLEQAVKKHAKALPSLLEDEEFTVLQGTHQEKLDALKAVTRNTWLVARARLTLDQLAELTRKQRRLSYSRLIQQAVVAKARVTLQSASRITHDGCPHMQLWFGC